MSASFYVRPLPKNPGKRLPVTSSFADVMREAFGDLPIVLSDANDQTLRGISAGASDKGVKEAIQEIRDQIEAHGEVEVRVEY